MKIRFCYILPIYRGQKSVEVVFNVEAEEVYLFSSVFKITNFDSFFVD